MIRSPRLLQTLGVFALLASILFQPAAAQNAEVYVRQVSPADAALDRAEALDLIEGRLAPFGRSVLQAYLEGDGLTDGHFALVAQDGGANRAVLNQTGWANLAVIEQYGDGLVTELRQAGRGNVYGAWLRGEDLSLNVAQEGNDNLYLLEVEGGTGYEATVLQRGDRNRAVQLGAGAVPFSIEQIGNDMQLIIHHEGAR